MNIRLHAASPQGVRALRCALLRALALAVLCSLAGVNLPAKEKPPVQYQIPTPPPPDFSTLQWLEGKWAGRTEGNGPAGELTLTVSSDLEKRILILRGELSFAATPTEPALKESWLGILSAADNGPGFILRVFSTTGFNTRYRVTAEGPEFHLNPEGGDYPPPGWLFRKVWARTGTDEFTETVSAAPPGKAFFDYYAARFARVSPLAKLPLRPQTAPVMAAPH